MYVKTSNKSKPNNGMTDAGASSEGLSPGKYPIVGQDGPNHHRTNTIRRTKRRKRSQEENWVVMQCYYRSECGRNGYRKRTHPIWNEMGMFNVTEQKLVDQKNNILMANRLSDLKLEETQRNINDIRHCEVGL